MVAIPVTVTVGNVGGQVANNVQSTFNGINKPSEVVRDADSVKYWCQQRWWEPAVLVTLFAHMTVLVGWWL